jgi:putative component of membrane protein insertase Oxa1/YidC/SpoIIIJ protein YidD
MTVGILFGCATWPASAPASYIDASFRLKKIELASTSGFGSPSVRAYQKLFSQNLGSQCRYLPSDSRYHILLAQNCGPIKATIKSMARSLLEYDAPKLGRPVVYAGNRVFYEDLPNDCGWL